MGIFSGLFKSRDKPKNSYDSLSYTYFFGRSHAGKPVNDRTALQQIAVYACVVGSTRTIAAARLSIYRKRKRAIVIVSLYFLLLWGIF